jgi:hypothetical protein
MNRVIEVKVSPTGDVTIQTKGYTGNDCLQASRFLEQALGLSLSETRSAEFYQAATTDQHLEQQ